MSEGGYSHLDVTWLIKEATWGGARPSALGTLGTRGKRCPALSFGTSLDLSTLHLAAFDSRYGIPGLCNLDMYGVCFNTTSSAVPPRIMYGAKTYMQDGTAGVFTPAPLKYSTQITTCIRFSPLVGKEGAAGARNAANRAPAFYFRTQICQIGEIGEAPVVQVIMCPTSPHNSPCGILQWHSCQEAGPNMTPPPLVDGRAGRRSWPSSLRWQASAIETRAICAAFRCCFGCRGPASVLASSRKLTLLGAVVKVWVT